MERHQPSSTAAELRQIRAPTTSQRVLSTTARPGHAQRQVAVADQKSDLAFSVVFESRDETEDSLIITLRRMGIKAPKQFDLIKDINFETWLERTEFYLSAIKVS